MVTVFRDVVGTCDLQTLNKYPHYGIAGHNLHNKIDVENEGSSYGFPYSCMQPLPFLPPARVSRKVLQGEDPVTVLVKNKCLWKHQVAVHRDRYQTRKETRKVCKFLEDIISSHAVSQNLSQQDADFVELFSRDPDEEFDGTYNWYYSGGCLDQVEMEDQVFLLTTQGKKKDQLCVLPLKMKKNWQASSVASIVQPTRGHTIHQLRGIYKQDKGFIGVRLHKTCYLYSLKPNLHLERMHEARSECPFTGLDLSHHFAGTYCTVTTSRCVQVWDINTRNHVTSGIPIKEHLQDKWSSVSYSTLPHMIMMADRCCTYFLDKRNGLSKSSLLLCPKKSNMLEHCETISLVLQSCVLSHALYMCTSHHVFLYDIRGKSKPLQRWTHLLCSTPSYGCTVALGTGEELVCLGNQKPGEIVTLFNSWDGEVPYCQIPPFALPNLHEALHSAHKHGLWLDPFTQQRVKLSLTGLVWLPAHTSQLTLLSQTAAGDVFSHVLEPRDLLQSNERKECDSGKDNSMIQKSNVNDNSEILKDYSKRRDLRCLANWEEQLLKSYSAILKVTTRKDLTHIYKRFDCGYRHHKAIEKRIKKGRWEMSKLAMESCVDILAPRILAVWGIEEEQEWYGEEQKLYEEETHSEEELPPTACDKVQAWLTSVQNEEQNEVSHSVLPEKQPSHSNSLNMSSDREIRQLKKPRSALNTPQSRNQSHTPRNDSLKMIPRDFRTKFSTSTPFNSLLSHTQIMDHQVNDIFSQNILDSLAQDEHLRDIQSSKVKNYPRKKKKI